MMMRKVLDRPDHRVVLVTHRDGGIVVVILKFIINGVAPTCWAYISIRLMP